MAIIKPFQGVRPNPDLVRDVASVPYDVVSREEALELCDNNPASFLRIVRSEVELPTDSNPYSEEVYSLAKQNIQKFLDKGTLIKDDAPSLYLYRIQLGEHVQTGLVCCSSVDDYDNDIIKKHEKTRPAKEDDRTKHIAATGTHTGPVFLTFRSNNDINTLISETAQSEPLYDFEAEDGVQHTLWKTTDCASLVAAFKELDCTYIADGHHRAASASRCREQLRNANASHSGKEAYNYFLTVLFPDSEVAILPYNRVVFSLGDKSPEGILSQLREIIDVTDGADPTPTKKGDVSMFLDGKWYGLSLLGDAGLPSDPVARLEVSMLHSKVLAPIFCIGDERTDENIDFIGGIRGTEHLESLVNSGKASCAFSLFPTSVNELIEIADSGQIMAPKSTWFEPKLRSGLISHTFEGAPDYE